MNNIFKSGIKLRINIKSMNIIDINYIMCKI